AVVDDVVPEARDDGTDVEHRLHQIPMYCKATANMASRVITQTMACTTVPVVCSPTLRESRATDSPMRQPISAMKAANTGALASPMTTALIGSTACSRFAKAV